MATIEKFTGIIAFIVVLATFYFPRFHLRNAPYFTGKELRQAYPHLGKFESRYGAFQVVIGIISLLFFAAYPRFDGYLAFQSIFQFLPFITILTIYEAVFSLITGVYPAIIQFNWERFVYDDHQSLRWIAQTQLGLAILETAASLILFQVFK